MEKVVVERIPLEKAMDLLRKDGIVVNPEQAGAILNFLYLVADIIVDQYLSDQY
jgi:hypothetical protein